MKNLLMTISFLVICSCQSLHGQGWLKYYGKADQWDTFTDVIETTDQGYLTTGVSDVSTFGLKDIIFNQN